MSADQQSCHSAVMPASFNRFLKFSAAAHVFRPDTPLRTHTMSVSLFFQVENTQHSLQKEKPNCPCQSRTDTIMTAMHCLLPFHYCYSLRVRDSEIEDGNK